MMWRLLLAELRASQQLDAKWYGGLAPYASFAERLSDRFTNMMPRIPNRRGISS